MRTEGEILKKILSSLDDGIILLDGYGIITYSNQSARNILGFESPQMSGQSLPQLLSNKEHHKDLMGFIDKALEQESLESHDIIPYRGHKNLNQDIYIKAKSIMLNTEINEKRRFILLVVSDVTQMMDYHRRLLAEKVDGMERVARAVAHSIRNPVTSIGGLAKNLLEKGPTNKKEEKYLQRILKDSKRLEQIVIGVREYNDLSEMKVEYVDMHDLLSILVDKYKSRAEQQNIKLEYPHSAESSNDSYTMRADPRLLKRLFIILLENALEAIQRDGKIAINLSLTTNGFTVVISDDGKGISQKDMPFLFDPLFTTKPDAIGMNLAIALRIVREHHGTLDVESIPGEGTIFKIVNSNIKCN